MSYVTPAQLADGPGSAQELAELFQIDQGLLVATIAGADRSDWTADEIAAADAALASIERFIVRADGEVNTRLARRGYTLPMNPVQFPVLTVWAHAITRYHVNPQRDKTNEETGRIERDYREALRALDLVAAGKLSLGAGDPLDVPASSDEGAVRIVSNERMFSRGSMGRL
jgi:phage gp36-like protein